MENNEKVVLFTHGIDIDGYGCAVLARLAFDDVKIFFADNFGLDSEFINALREGKLSDCDRIFITDHCPTEELCASINRRPALRDKTIVLDHHISRIDLPSKFSWVTVVDQNKQGKCSGTSLFFEHLLKNGCFSQLGMRSKLLLADMVELTRQYDTWDWTKTNNVRAKDLNTLAMAIGREDYVNRMVENIEMGIPYLFSHQDIYDIDSYEKAFNQKLEMYLNKISVVDFQGVKAGYVEIEDRFKNDIAESVRKSPLSKKIEVLLMPIEDRGTVSLRSVDPNFDCAALAEANDGGGHKAAASFPLRKLKKDFLKTRREI